MGVGHGCATRMLENLHKEVLLDAEEELKKQRPIGC
jgi:hypothetical protein